MSVRLAPIIHFSYHNPEYEFTVLHDRNASSIRMQMHGKVLTTKSLPNTIDILSDELPEIFQCECFNDRNISFREEARQTEIAHLFEHILIEYLCSYGMKLYNCRTVVNGLTTWNWYKNPRGSFEITIDMGLKHRVIFRNALHDTIVLFEKVLNSRTDELN